MRVLQVIDSLRPGGAERMAVNCANALSAYYPGDSYICCTRMEGDLKDELEPTVNYFFLNRKSSLDLKALFKLKQFVKKEEIEVVHAHGTSYFLAGLLKISGARFKLLWHDHYGEKDFDTRKDAKILYLFSSLFDGIVAVNDRLERWSLENLQCRRVKEIRNFISSRKSNIEKKTHLHKNTAADFVIICVANLRPQKDHFNLFRAFELLLREELPISLHLIGSDPKTEYSKSVLEYLRTSPATNKMFYYGQQKEIASFLAEADLGVLSSESEGLPLALLEYGMSGLAVVCTDVGKCREVLGENGKIVPAGQPEQLAMAIKEYVNNPGQREKDAKELQRTMMENYSEEKVFPQLHEFYRSLLNSGS